ncbi:GNAT family N-acetyltransferase [Jeotgalibacillus proteolyticus]|uniref:GNAT family N-acetyltransferase n=1 Tax=Jeotgalibacillus proteolyticus TaxID=2082395 RepID=A0A2S5GF93_9BACL|nr:GNAT family N-acetyltransferase [Jeotgalibacillus proteolyticus]PPA71700.1 GNAT family N-acetyltransferase [Jeotgalibacillus proteolyticus]
MKANQSAIINLPIAGTEVPELRESIGWERRDQDFPLLFERCNFWAGVRSNEGTLAGFGYICGMGLQHGYIEDIIVHPDHQKKGIGKALIKGLLEEAEKRGIEIVTLTFSEEHAEFYQSCGFTLSTGGVWRVEHRNRKTISTGFR